MPVGSQSQETTQATSNLTSQKKKPTTPGHHGTARVTGNPGQQHPKKDGTR